ncbi:MAG TPA: DUF4384 domain-containing protein [Pyrinomonadaceae bacterium]|nr:DUF4384 domain-containing protein [Pyrinomonadaceae bacterium]
MRYKLFSPLLFVALVFVVAVRAQDAQQPQQPPPQDEEVLTRGAFITTRPKNKEGAKASAGAGAAVTAPGTANAPAVAANTPPKNAKKNVSKPSSRSGGKKNAGKSAASAKDETAAVKTSTVGTTSGAGEAATTTAGATTKPHPIGLGYTFFTLGDNGLAVRTDSSRQFRTGEAIRIALETNTDGYLYIFHTENDGEPQMIFPDTRLNGGDNFVRAHVPYEIPSSEEESEEMRWFVFKDPPAAERLYIVLARQPLAGVPAGAALANYCFEAQNVCPWRPAPAVWTQLKATQEREQVAVSKVRDQGRAQTADEREATTRGLGLAAGAPTPSVIRMTASPDAKMLVTAIDLIHK